MVLIWINEQVLYQEALGREIDKQSDLEKEYMKLKRDLVINKLLETTLDSDIPISEEEIQAYYEANQDGLVLTEDVVHAYHLLLNTLQEATETRARLRAGETFEQLAKEIASEY